MVNQLMGSLEAGLLNPNMADIKKATGGLNGSYISCL